ncbi:hypothetical protein ECDEC6C_5313 [Escherichia coli DEC6C]|nr:hypothetical protein ECDEC6C_5313 [Escherichia coli DEC6C]
MKGLFRIVDMNVSASDIRRSNIVALTYETVVSVSAGTGRGYRPAEREYPATITPVVAVIQDGVSGAC